MTKHEKRSAERFIYRGEPHGSMSLSCCGRSQPVLKVRDISNAGVRLEVSKVVNVSDKVVLLYVEGGVSMEVFGSVIWTKPLSQENEESDETGGYLAGIHLLNPVTLISLIQNVHA